MEFEEEAPAQQAIQDLDGCQSLDFSEALKIEVTAKKKPEGDSESLSNVNFF